MRLCRFNDDRLGVVDPKTETIADVSAALKLLPAQRYPLANHDLLIANLPKIKAEAKRLAPRAKKIPVAKAKLLAPVANPGKIIIAPVNYADHLEEATKDPGLAHGRDMKNAEIGKWGMAMKATSALVGPSQGVRLRRPLAGMENRNDHELELVAVVGRRGTNIKREDGLKYIAGYCIGLDMSLRGPQFPCFRKSIDSYAVVGPWLVTADEFGSPDAVDIQLWVNDEVRQKSNTRYLVYDVARLVEFASSFYTLEAGDIIYTGTPAGVGPVKAGDRIVSEIQGIGRMTVEVRDA